MAELVEELPRRAVVEADRAHPRVSWSAVFAGAVTAVGIWMLLYALGLAIGASALNVRDAGNAKSTGIFTGWWGAISPLVALFIGGLVAGRGAGVAKRTDGALHGLVTWGLASIAGAWLLASLVGAIAGGAASIGRTAAQAVGAASNEAPQIAQAMRSAGIDTNDLVRPLNERLRAEGRPTVSPHQLEAAARDALTRSVRTGSIDRDVIVQSLADDTSLSRDDANQLAGQLESQMDKARSQLAGDLQSAANAASKALWGAFVALILGLIAAVVGGLIGVPWGHRQRPRPERAPAPEPERPARAPTAPREVYP